ncbi:MAG: hypothetical protein WAT39_03460 [Planctomycetota bacterium]
MSRHLPWGCVSLLALPSLVNAQAWSVSAVAPVQGTALAIYVFGPYQPATLPVGPVAPGTYLAAVSGSNTNVSASWSQASPAPYAAVAFTATTSSSATWPSWYFDYGASTARLASTLNFTLHAPQPARGRLWIRRLGVLPSQAGNQVTVDVGADGVVELSAQSPGPVEVPLVIGGSGAVVRVVSQVFNHASVLTPLQVTTNFGVEVQFFPDQPAVQTFANTGAGGLLSFVHAFDNTLTLTNGYVWQTPVLMVIGAQPVNIPVMPGVTLLVSLDMICYGSPIIVVPPQLPPGTALYVQGLVVDAGSVPRSTNSLRVLWP